mmetsp:Transcript_27100/g.69797  ORF Transcript_27100/g.69797 Transcript_27100/m.69797 type:complete len:154 (+) Transcript_27100:313-774(+)
MVVKGVLIDFLAVGVVLCSVCWLIANIYLREKEENHTQGASGPTEDDVEWLYAFDVHCNSYVPVCLLLYYLQFLLLPLLNTTSIFSAILSNLLYLGAFIYYNYITFLGYNTLPQLQRSTLFFVYPSLAALAAFLLLTLFGFNSTRFVVQLHFG